MQIIRYLDCLASDAARLRSVAARALRDGPGAAVPTCPGWTVADLVTHVGHVYLHKAAAMRTGVYPSPWPPAAAGAPLDLFDQGYIELTSEFAAREPDSPTGTWYEPQQTVGFWIRRMAQETLIHRVDAELALSEPVAPIPGDLADDGVDEVLVRFLGYGSQRWRDEFGALLDDCDGRAVWVATSTGAGGWLVRPTMEAVQVTTCGSSEAAGASVTGSPDAVLRWLWRRAGDAAVRLDGDPSLVSRLRDLLGIATE